MRTACSPESQEDKRTRRLRQIENKKRKVCRATFMLILYYRHVSYLFVSRIHLNFQNLVMFVSTCSH